MKLLLSLATLALIIMFVLAFIAQEQLNELDRMVTTLEVKQDAN